MQLRFRVLLTTLAFAGCAMTMTTASAQRVINGGGDDEFTIEETELKLIDGPGNRIIWGVGQDLVITEKKDGDGSTTLRNFGKITIKEKNGAGRLIIEADCKEVEIADINGPGNVYLRNTGKKKIGKKDGGGDIYFLNSPPIVDLSKIKNGPGSIKREK